MYRMRVSKAELSVGLFLLMIALSAGLGIAQQRVVDAAMLQTGLHEVAQRSFLLFLGMQSLIGVAFAAGVFWILPTVRRQAREQGQLMSLTGALTRRSNSFEQAALTDPLTGMHNRRYFDAALEQYLNEFAKINRHVGLLMIDLDHFKAINDTHGHDAGDIVLKVVAARLLEFSRHHDIVARFGGEEFALVAPNVTQLTLHSFADRLRGALAESAIDLGSKKLRITVSIGLATSRPSDTGNSLLKRADVNLYRAKQSGRNRVCA